MVDELAMLRTQSAQFNNGSRVRTGINPGLDYLVVSCGVVWYVVAALILRTTWRHSLCRHPPRQEDSTRRRRGALHFNSLLVPPRKTATRTREEARLIMSKKRRLGLAMKTILWAPVSPLSARRNAPGGFSKGARTSQVRSSNPSAHTPLSFAPTGVAGLGLGALEHWLWLSC